MVPGWVNTSNRHVTDTVSYLIILSLTFQFDSPVGEFFVVR